MGVGRRVYQSITILGVNEPAKFRQGHMSERLTSYPNALDWFEPDIRLGSILSALWRRKLWIAGAVGGATALGLAGLALIPPRYGAEARVLIERNENTFTKPLQEREQLQLDKEAAASQVQLLLSRDLARTVADKLKLVDNPEFAGSASISPLGLLMRLAGLQKRSGQSADERILDSFYDRLNVFQIQDSRVITVEFRSRNPELAARAANALVDGYIDQQRSTKLDSTRQASSWLGAEIERLRKKAEQAEQRVEEFRGRSGLLLGTNNTSLNAQRLSELNTQLIQAQAQHSPAQT